MMFSKQILKSAIKAFSNKRCKLINLNPIFPNQLKFNLNNDNKKNLRENYKDYDDGVQEV